MPSLFATGAYVYTAIRLKGFPAVIEESADLNLTITMRLSSVRDCIVGPLVAVGSVPRVGEE